VKIAVILNKFLLDNVLLIKFLNGSDGLIYSIPPDLLGLHDLLHAEYGRELLLDLVNLYELVLKHLVPAVQARYYGLLVEFVLEVLSVVLLHVLGKVLVELSDQKLLSVLGLFCDPEGLNLLESERGNLGDGDPDPIALFDLLDFD